MITRGRLLLLLPLLAVALLTVFILALPGFVSSAKHRATIEALASSLTGRQVHINGKLSLALLPAPQLIAERITISSLTPGPAAETITARSLTLNIAAGALLKGRLQASSMTLVSPTITIPWPLPPRSIAYGAQPALLAALHAQIDNGRIMIGALRFTHVNADIFTGAGGAVSGSGSCLAGVHPLTISLSLGARDAAGGVAVTVDARSNDAAATAHLSGTLNAARELLAHVSFSATPPGASAQVTGTADVKFTEREIQAAQIQLRQGGASLAGGAALGFAPEQLDATLTGQNLQLAPLRGLLGIGAIIPARLDLTARNVGLSGVVLPLLHVAATADAGGVAFREIGATLTGGATVTASGSIDPAGGMTGTVQFDAATAAALNPSGLPLPANWQTAHLAAGLTGDPTHLALNQLSGRIGPAQITGTVLLTAGAAAGRLHFDQLDLTDAVTHQTASAARPDLTLDGEITADHASIGKSVLKNLLLDGRWNGQLTLRRGSAALDGGIIAVSARSGAVSSARGLLTLPSAAPLLPLLPAAFRPPLKLAQAPLTISVLARGPATAFTGSAVATLGGITVTTSPVINLQTNTAAGPFTLRHPDAIAALAAFGWKTGLAWPGAGSIALAADFAVSPGNFALPDFVLSLGDLTANGTVGITADHQISADIDADTLALPPLGRLPDIPWAALAAATGKVNVTARKMLLGGAPVLGASSASLTLTPNLLSLDVPGADVAGGRLSGSLSAATSRTAPPRLTAKFTLAGADATAIHLPVAFPVTLGGGLLDATANLTATGYGPAVWDATIAGPMTLTATNGALNGFSLAGITAALNLPHRAAALRTALTDGLTAYAKLGVSGQFQNGNYTIANAGLTGPNGAASATGSVDLADQALALNFSFAPAVSPPLTINMASIGAWKSPKQIPALGDALRWKQAK